MFKRKTLVRLTTALSLVSAFNFWASTPAQAQEWTVTLLKFYNKGVDAYNHQDWATAKENFREAIGIQPDKHVSFYLGLLNTCVQSQEWDQVVFAGERIWQMFPEYRNEVAFDYGTALYKQFRYNDAIPILKIALAVADKQRKPYLPEKVSESVLTSEMTVTAPPVNVQPVEEKPPPPRPVERLNTKDYLSFENAVKSEEIVQAVFEGFDKGDIHYMNPPIAHFRIVKILKGSETNPAIPVWFEFHDKVNLSPPANWKFNEKEMMPKKGSQWILFIEFLSARNGAYDLYQGSYGRQPATEENLNLLYQLLDKYNMRKTDNQ